MSIKKSLNLSPNLLLALAALVTFASVHEARAQTAPVSNVNCLMNFPDGTPVGTNDGAVFYPDSRPLRTIDGEILYPDGNKLLATDGTMTYTDGKLLKSPAGEVKYYDGVALRSADGSTFNYDGSANPLVRYEIPFDDSTTLILRAWKRGSTYKLHAKGKATELVVSIDLNLNISCEFVKPIGPKK